MNFFVILIIYIKNNVPYLLINDYKIKYNVYQLLQKTCVSLSINSFKNHI